MIIYYDHLQQKLCLECSEMNNDCYILILQSGNACETWQHISTHKYPMHLFRNQPATM